MTQDLAPSPAGWYRDPSPQNLDGFGQRYWDGSAWTEHVHHPGFRPVYAPPAPATTADGQPLAEWWQRLFALLLDGLILAPLTVTMYAFAIVSQWDDIEAWFDSVDSTEASANPFRDLPDVFNPFSGPGLLLTGTLLVLVFVYNLVFVLWKQATPGKMLMGLRIRSVDDPGLPAAAAWKRVGFTGAVSVINAIPIVGSAFAALGLIDYFWVFKGTERQTVHDKVAGTQVVKIR